MHYPLEVMLTCVRWYSAYPLSLCRRVNNLLLIAPLALLEQRRPTP
jgi:transposase-like protein